MMLLRGIAKDRSPEFVAGHVKRMALLKTKGFLKHNRHHYRVNLHPCDFITMYTQTEQVSLLGMCRLPGRSVRVGDLAFWACWQLFLCPMSW